ncbi:hypothetical protein [Streptomonospora wellingtoniae]|uniref:Uncharacterized protein n=1 Tax=Streptomonospora wellingtoniae TaxID=3075544 RepID=A0ABU2KPY1_9ACTN|nr:hypothetical protein [Streptomonospora sp. DSM 45055]MDT0301319.1 hypothetical protein [Streptomonospora sp. DSM 45055]
MSGIIDALVDPMHLFVLVGVVAQIAVLVNPTIVWRQRGRNRLDALPPRLAAVFVWTTRGAALAAIVVLVAFLFA